MACLGGGGGGGGGGLTCMDYVHSCQPLFGVNLSPEFVNLCFPYAGWALFVVVFAGCGRILNSNRHAWQWKEEATLC